MPRRLLGDRFTVPSAAAPTSYAPSYAPPDGQPILTGAALPTPTPTPAGQPTGGTA